MAKKSAKTAAAATSSITVPGWMLGWLLISSILTLYDAAFVLTRPASLSGGSLHWLFFSYDSYIVYDPVYANLKDAFGVAQSYINLIEIALVFIALTLIPILPTSSSPHVVLLIATSSTLLKTVLYLVYSVVDVEHSGHYSLTDWTTWDAGYVSVSLLPVMQWIIFPVATLISLGGQLARAASHGGKGKAA
jgi:hypothetical protein